MRWMRNDQKCDGPWHAMRGLCAMTGRCDPVNDIAAKTGDLAAVDVHDLRFLGIGAGWRSSFAMTCCGFHG